MTMAFLIDTNVISELRKGERAARSVRRWFESVNSEEIFLSVLTVGEIRRGVEAVRRRDKSAARALMRWLDSVVKGHAGRILAIDEEVAGLWGELNVPNPVPVVDGLIAATAKAHGLTVATRNTKDIVKTGVACVNPFET